MQAVLLILVVTFVTCAACGNSDDGEESREIVGVVVDIGSGSGFGDVKSFTVKQGTQEFEIFVKRGRKYDFPLAHLNAHRAGAEPVRVDAVARNDKLYAISIGDA